MREKGYWQRKFERRRLLAGATAGGAGLTAALALGCSSGQQPATPQTDTTTAVQPKRGGTLTHGYDVTGTPVLDPNTDSPVTAGNRRLYFEGILAYTPNTFEIKPELAARWEQPSQTEYIFTLQQGVKWHNKPPLNGRAFTAQDAVAGLERVRTNNPRFTSRPLIDGVKIEAVDATRIKLTTPSPDALFINKLSGDGLTLVPPEVAEMVDPGFGRAELAIGTGPFMLAHFQEKANSESVRNPDYWKPGLPYIDSFRTIALHTGYGNERSWAASQGGQVDITVIPGNQVKGYIAQQGAGFQAQYAPDLTPYNLVPNTRNKPFDDMRVCRGLRLFVDHDEAITAWAETWAGRGRHGSFLPPNMDAWDLTHEEYARLPEWSSNKDAAIREAMTMLSASGFNRDNPLRFEFVVNGDNGGMEAMGVLLNAQFRRLGQGVVDTTIQRAEGTAYQTVRASRNYSFMMSSNATSYHDPDAWFAQVYRTGAARNYWNYSDPTLDTMADRQRAIFDLNQRKAAVKEILMHMINTWPSTGMTSAYALNATKRNVRGFAPELWFNGHQYQGVWLDS
jgi:peptide/nickel transport system substrate-binding protein